MIDVVSGYMLGEIPDGDPAAFGVDSGPLPFFRGQSLQHANVGLAQETEHLQCDQGFQVA